MEGGQRPVGHSVGDGLVLEAEGVPGYPASIDTVVLASGDAEGVLDLGRVFHPEEQPHSVAGARKGIDVALYFPDLG